ncbi:MAG: response regulator transcription factor [Clostridiales bacterium]|nr:response regulator transcription factor [Clostridiales bacterium]
MENSVARVLIVEDEVKLARFVELELKHEGYEVIVANDGRAALEKFEEEKPNIILLDLMLPGLSGIEVCRRIRKNSDVPIIMLTAKGEVMDKVMGLDNGADDYITKPFAIEEVLARMRVALKHKRTSAEADDENKLTVKDLTLDLGKRTVKLGDNNIDLTKREFDLLAYLIKNKNIVISREQILNKVWGYDYFGETNVVDVYVRYLRTKIDDKYNEKFIHTIRGIGYYVKDDEE